MNAPTEMKMLVVVFNISLEDDVLAILNRHGSPCFTQWPRLVGRGVSTGPKMDNDVWPGANSALFSIVDAATADALLSEIQALRDEVGLHEGVKAFIMNVEKMTGNL